MAVFQVDTKHKLVVIPAEAAAAPDCQPDVAATAYAVESDADVPLLFNNKSIAILSAPDITTVALVVLEGVGFVVADVSVYLFGSPPKPVILSFVTSIVDDVLKFNPVNTRYPFDESYVALLITCCSIAFSYAYCAGIAAAPVCQPDAAAKLYTVESCALFVPFCVKYSFTFICVSYLI